MSKLIEDLKLINAGEVISPETLNTPLIDLANKTQEKLDVIDKRLEKLDGIESGAEVNVQSDWTETDDNSDSYIKNKPELGTMSSKDANDYRTHSQNETIFVKQEANKGLISKDDQEKLDGIEAGAEVNVQANWAETNHTSDSFIRNKPELGTMSSKNAALYRTHSENKEIFVEKEANKGLISKDDQEKLDGIEDGAQVNVQSDWTQTNVNSDSYIKNKPELGTMSSKNASDYRTHVQNETIFVKQEANKGLISSEDQEKLDGIEAGAEVNVNADWNETNPESDAFIQNKPLLGTMSSKNANNYRTHAQNETIFVKQEANKGLSTEDFTTGHKTKLDRITIATDIDLDEIKTSLDGLSSAVVLKGEWQASSGVFPENAKAGWSYVVTDDGDVDGIEFKDGDRLLAVKDNPSTTVYKSNWLKLDYTDRVNTVAGRTGDVELYMSDIKDIGTMAGKSADDYRTHAQNEEIFVKYNGEVALLPEEDLIKLRGIETGAQVNVKSDWNEANPSSDAFIQNKPISATQTEAEAGSSSTLRLWSPSRITQLVNSWWNKSENKTKLDGVATGATKNATDAQLRDRTTHTGVQPISSVSGLQTALNTKVETDDPRMSNAREWTASVISQSEAELGESTVARKFTAQRVRQAISSWWNSSGIPETLANKVDNTDARLTNSREWTGSTVSQAEAEAGTSNTRRAWTALRVRQAIDAWWSTIGSTFGKTLLNSSDANSAKSSLGLHSVASSGNYNDLSNRPASMSQAEASAGTSTTARLITSKVLTDTITSAVSGGVNADALTKANNLSDLTNVLAARSNLGLGSAAVKNVGENNGDVVEVGAFGLKANKYLGAINSEDLWESGFYASQSSTTGTPVAANGGQVIVSNWGSTNHVNQLWFGYNGDPEASANSDIFLKVKRGGVWAENPIRIWTSGSFDPSTKTDATRTITAGNGLSGGGNLTANRTITLGTPSTLTGSTTNSVTATSHTHEIIVTKSDVGLSNVTNVEQAAATTQVIAGNGLSGGGTLAANRTITLGTPSTLTGSTTNAVTATSHTHEIVVTKADVGLGNVLNVASYSKTESDGRYYTQSTADSRYAYKAGSASQDFSAKDATVSKLKFGTNAEMVYNASSKSIDFIFA